MHQQHAPQPDSTAYSTAAPGLKYQLGNLTVLGTQLCRIGTETSGTVYAFYKL